MPDNSCWDEMIAIDEFCPIISNSTGCEWKGWIFRSLWSLGATNRKRHRKRQGTNSQLTCHTNIIREIREYRGKLSWVVKPASDISNQNPGGNLWNSDAQHRQRTKYPRRDCQQEQSYIQSFGTTHVLFLWTSCLWGQHWTLAIVLKH